MCRFNANYKFTHIQNRSLLEKIGLESEKREEDDGFFNEEMKETRSSGSLTNQMGGWMNKLEKLSVSAVTRMKTYIKKKEIDEEPNIECYDD